MNAFESRHGRGLAAALAALALGAPVSAQDLTQHHISTFVGEEALDYFGRAVASAGDVDGDGVPDVIVGAPQLYSTETGKALVFSGRTGLVIHELLGDAPTAPLTDRFGFAVAGVGDVDGGGRADVVVGAPRDDNAGTSSGCAMVISGETGARLYVLEGDAAGDELGTSVAGAGDVNFDGVPDVLVGAPGGRYARVYSGEWIRALSQSQAPVTNQILYEVTGGSRFGAAVAIVDRLDADDFADFVVGAPAEGAPGQVRVYAGVDGALLRTWTGASVDDGFGEAVSGAGDVNADGYDDVIVGAPFDDAAGAQAGVARVYSGEWVTATAGGGAPLSPEQLFAFSGGAPGDFLGISVAGAGDVDADTRADLVVGATASTNAAGLGYARVFAGATGAVLYDVPGDVPGDFRGWAVAGAGDVNADGYGDVLIGAPGDAAAGSGAGSVRVFSGAKMVLASDVHAFSLIQGGTQTLHIDAGPGYAGQIYFVLGSATGTTPGIPSDVGILPVNLDFYYVFVLSFVNQPPFLNYLGVLDANGRGTARFQLPAGSDPTLVNLHLNHAAVAIALNPTVLTLASNPVPLSFFVENCAAAGGAGDCNGNGILDVCDIDDGTSTDCNGNGIPDECDIALGFSPDMDLDGIPDECTQVLFVDANAVGADDGTSWDDAFVELADALQVTTAFTQVWVAGGTYYPDRGGQYLPGDEAASFVVRAAVGVYGGFDGADSVLFPGGETSLSQRDWLANPTVLSGDLAGDDSGGIGDPSRSENARNVVTFLGNSGSLTVLDGFTVAGGNADLTAPCDFYNVPLKECTGGGVWSLASPRLANCVFRDNFGGRRGGALFSTGEPRIVGCTFLGNDADQGGAIFNDSGSRPTLVDCAFLGNTAREGGAVYGLGVPSFDTPLFVNCLFSGNSALFEGGAIYNLDVTPTLVSCTLAGNLSGSSGGGLYSTPAVVVTIDNTILWGNLDAGGADETAQLEGGTPKLTSCLVQGWTGGFGGALNFGADPLFQDADGADGVSGTADDDLRPLSGSPAVDGGFDLLVGPDVLDLDRDGDTTELTPFDLAGNARFLDDAATPDTGSGIAPIVDVGAYEHP